LELGPPPIFQRKDEGKVPDQAGKPLRRTTRGEGVLREAQWTYTTFILSLFSSLLASTTAAKNPTPAAR